MNSIKSIDNKLILLIFANIITSIISIALYILYNSVLIPALIFLFIFNLFFVFYFIIKLSKVYTLTLFASILFYLILAMTFKRIRELFPDQQISSEYSSSFVSYFNYPPLFDYILFLIIILFPFAAYNFLNYLVNVKKHKN